MKTAIVDLDGTLCVIDHRLRHVTGSNRNWDAFFHGIPDDELNEPIAAVVDALRHAGYEIVLCSGRPEKCRDVTVAWLEKYGIYYSSLYMRPDGDTRPDHIVKKQLLDGIREDGFEPFVVIDDRQSVVDMWREEGLLCLQCAPVQPMVKPEAHLMLMVGPSGAGKSTFLKDAVTIGLLHPSWILSSDQIRHELCGDFRNQNKNAEVFEAIREIAAARLRRGLKVVIDATNIRRKDRMAMAAVAQGVCKVSYLVLDRPIEEKRKSGGWRNQLPGGFDLLGKHGQTFNSNLKDILAGDGLPNVQVLDLREDGSVERLVGIAA